MSLDRREFFLTSALSWLSSLGVFDHEHRIFAEEAKVSPAAVSVPGEVNLCRHRLFPISQREVARGNTP
jgi:hypothetical protein